MWEVWCNGFGGVSYGRERRENGAGGGIKRAKPYARILTTSKDQLELISHKAHVV
jgi:hypothetical protein